MPRRVLKAVVEQVPRHREMFIRLLTFCKQRRTLEEAETQIASYPEYPQAAQSPYHLIMTMVNEGGRAGSSLTRRDKSSPMSAKRG